MVKEHNLQNEIDRLSKASKLDSWTSFVETLQVPGDVMPALTAMRPEMLKLVEPRQLSQLEHQAYLNLIAGLIETNVALREHATTTAHFVKQWMGQLQGIFPLAQKIQKFARFEKADDAYEDED